MKRWLGLLTAILGLSTGSLFSFEYQNEVGIDLGYRVDNVHHFGPTQATSLVFLEQKIKDAKFVQLDLLDTLTFDDRFFLEGLVGYGFGINSRDTTIGTYNISGNFQGGLPGFVFPLDNEGQDPQALDPSFETVDIYSHGHSGGHTWNVDFAAGGILCCENIVTLNPRLGYLYQSIKIHDATCTSLQGVYAGIAVPIVFDCFEFIPDFSYLFAGTADETIQFYTISTNEYEGLKKGCSGSVRGFRVSLALNYQIFCDCSIAFAWKYSNFHVGSKMVEIDPSVFWWPRTNWRTNQYLAQLNYSF